jgi:hypothetical protein
MTIKKEILKYLQKNNLSEVINIINARDLKNKLQKDLNNNKIIVKKSKI